MLFPHIVSQRTSLDDCADFRIIAIFIIERVGRRPLMLWCALGMGATMVILAGLYIETSENGNSAAQAVSILCLFVFNCWFTIGWLGMSW
jgi:hypothetical protein